MLTKGITECLVAAVAEFCDSYLWLVFFAVLKS